MIVDTMTYEEKREEYRRDFNTNVILAYINCFGKKKQYERIARSLPNDKKYKFKPVEYISKGGNRYVNFFFVNGRNGFKKEGILSKTILIYQTYDGKKAVMTATDDGLTTFWSQHFFERYRERGLKDMSLSLDETIIHFFNKLGFVSANSVDSDKYKNNIYGLLDDGLMLGEFIQNKEMMLSYHTFISNEMLQGDQYEELAYLVHSSYKNTNNNYRPDFIKKYEEKHMDKPSYYGKPIVLKGCNDDSFSFFNAKRFDDHQKAIEEFASHYLKQDFYIDCESKRLDIWFNYTDNQQKKGNTKLMCLGPIIYHTNTGLDYMVYRSTSFHSDINEITIVAPYIVGGEVFIAMQANTKGPSLLFLSYKLSVIETFRNQREDLKDWSLAETLFYFLKFAEMKDAYEGEDNRLIVESNYGQFTVSLIGDTHNICFEELNKHGTYTKLDEQEEKEDYSWIKNKSFSF